jgi:serine/threonine-protein kinase
VKVLDFGLAKLRQPGAMRTMGGVLLGTAEFMAPEQITSPDDVTGAVDVYALGVTLYLCLAGRLPFVADAPMDTINRHLHDQPAPLAELAPEAPPALAALIMRCLAKAASQRPTAAEVAAQLGALATELDAPPWDALATLRPRAQTRRLRGARELSPAAT